MGAQRRHSTKFIASGSQEAKETRYFKDEGAGRRG